MLRTAFWLTAALLVAGATIYFELVADIRTPHSRLAMRSAFVTHNKLPAGELAAATTKLKAKYGEATKVWQGPTGIYARQDGDILEIEPAHTLFHETLGMTEIEDDAGGRATFPFHISPYQLRDSVHPNLVPSLNMRVATSFRNPPAFSMADFSIEQCRMVSSKALKMGLAEHILGLGNSTICSIVWKREPSRRMLAGIVVADGGRWIRPLAKGLCRRMSDAWLADEHRTHPDQQPDYLQCFLVDRPENQPFGSGVSSFAYELRKDGSLAVFVARPLGIEEVPLGPDPRVPKRPVTSAAATPPSPTKSAEGGVRALTPDSRMPTFHRVGAGEPERAPEPEREIDAAHDVLRRDLVEAANALAQQPCDEAAKARYLKAAVTYARSWIAALPCLEQNFCDPQLREKLNQTVGNPWQFDAMKASQRVHELIAWRKADFPKDSLVFVATLAGDAYINPLAELTPPEFFRKSRLAECTVPDRH